VSVWVYHFIPELIEDIVEEDTMRYLAFFIALNILKCEFLILRR
jgi:hypothetical protein